MILNNINEKWVSSTKTRFGNYREIFVNPSKEDLKDVIDSDLENKKYGLLVQGDIRFLASRDSKTVYVATSDLMHWRMGEELGYKQYDTYKKFFCGEGKYKNGKIEVIRFSDIYEDRYETFVEYGLDENNIVPSYIEICEELLSGKYDWLRRYNFDLSKIKSIVNRQIDDLRDAVKEPEGRKGKLDLDLDLTL